MSITSLQLGLVNSTRSVSLDRASRMTGTPFMVRGSSRFVQSRGETNHPGPSKVSVSKVTADLAHYAPAGPLEYGCHNIFVMSVRLFRFLGRSLRLGGRIRSSMTFSQRTSQHLPPQCDYEVRRSVPTYTFCKISSRSLHIKSEMKRTALPLPRDVQKKRGKTSWMAYKRKLLT